MIDADGLNMLAGSMELISGLTRPVVLTPHPGEFARLVGASVASVQADRIASAARPCLPLRTRSLSSSRGREPLSRMAAGRM